MSSTGNTEGRLSHRNITTGAWVLVGLLLITAASLFASRVEERIFPSVTNVQPSGYAAFAELLRRDGYDVVLNRDVSMEFEEGDVVVSTTFGEYDNDTDPDDFSFLGEEFSDLEEDFEEYDPWEELEDYETSLKEHLESGGTVINVFSRINFEQAERNVPERLTVVSSTDPEDEYSVSVPYGFQPRKALPYEKTLYGGWYISNDPFVTYTAVEEGLLVTIADGLGLCNRYLDQDQNAEFYLNVFRQAAPAGSRIVIVEAGIGNAIVPTVATTLGSWAVAARWQMILLFVVLVFTLSKRFGLPEIDRRAQKGSRELFDAIADVFRRSNNTGLALDNLLIEVDERIRSVIHAATSLNRSAMLHRVPIELKEQYLNVSELAVSKCTPQSATQAAKKLIELLENFENDSRSARGLKR